MTEESKSDNSNPIYCRLYEIDIDNEINYTKIVDEINNDINNYNEYVLILQTKLNKICKIDPISIIFKKSLVRIIFNCKKLDTHDYEYIIPNIILPNIKSTTVLTNKKTEYFLIIRFCIIVTRYMIIKLKHSNSKEFIKIDQKFIKIDQEFIKIDQEINKYLSIHVKMIEAITSYYNRVINGNYNWQIREGVNSLKYNYLSTKNSMREFLKFITIELEYKQKEDMIATRSIKSILGNFEEQISPSMIHKILTWLKKKDKKKYGNIKRGIKEQIIIELKKYDININADLLCKFIDDNIPSKFAKEWNINMYSNGKRLKNDEIRKLFKEEFYKREKESIRFKIVCPRLNSLPQNIEYLIISYLTSCS